MGPFVLLAGLAAGAYLLNKQAGANAPASGILPPGIPIPPDAQPVPTVRDLQGRVVPQPNTIVDPTSGKSYFVPQDPATRPPIPPSAPVLSSTVADAKTVQPEVAKKLAGPLAQEIRTRGKAYSKPNMIAFQKAAGLVADGWYGGRTRGALSFYGVPDAPPVLYPPLQTVNYKLA